MEGANHGPIRWLADTGCAADLIGLSDMTADDLKYVTPAADPICFSSANGPVWATSTLPLQGVALMEEMSPFVMEQTPAVLSVGRRCTQEGYAFHWPPRKSPYFIKPDGEKILCEVHAYVPYIPHREPTWAERLVAAAAPPNTLESQVKRARLTTSTVTAGGGNAPVAPAPEVAPIPVPRLLEATRPTRMEKVRTRRVPPKKPSR